MKTPSLTFIVAFAAGALLALGIRTARHQPYAAPAQATAPAHEMHAAPTATNTAAVNTICRALQGNHGRIWLRGMSARFCGGPGTLWSRRAEKRGG